MNRPYVKNFVKNHDTGILELMNPITKDKPYLHSFNSNRGKSKRPYYVVSHPLTGAFIGRIRATYNQNGNIVPIGNNRANTCKRTIKLPVQNGKCPYTLQPIQSRFKLRF